MGHKVHPLAMRLPLTRDWRSRWYAEKGDYKKLLLQDIKLREFIMTKLRPAGVCRVDIERSLNALSINVFVAKPGMVIGRGGAGLEDLRTALEREAGQKLRLDIEEVRNPDLNAYLVGRNIADQVEKRLPARRVINQAMERVMRSGAKGVKIIIAGRIGGSEISRREKVSSGTIPLATLRAPIDFASVAAKTATAGVTGIKVWIYADKKEEELG